MQACFQAARSVACHIYQITRHCLYNAALVLRFTFLLPSLTWPQIPRRCRIGYFGGKCTLPRYESCPAFSLPSDAGFALALRYFAPLVIVTLSCRIPYNLTLPRFDVCVAIVLSFCEMIRLSLTMKPRDLPFCRSTPLQQLPSCTAEDACEKGCSGSSSTGGP